jgi:hypothetical protein
MEMVNFSGYTHVDVESNDNTPMMAQQVYKNIGTPFPISHVRIYEGEPEGQLCAICGWRSSSDGPVTRAYAVQIEDSSEGRAFLVYGGDWGVRLRPAGSDAPWSVDDPEQWGETHLVLASEDDLTRA